MTTENQPTQTNQTPNQTDYTYFDQGDDLQDQQVQQVGFRRVQHFNENHTYHRGSMIENGGYGIKDDNADAPLIGKTETIKHRGGNSNVMKVARTIEVALIGFSPRYFVSEYDDPADPTRRVTLITPNYVYDLPGQKGRCRSAVSFFIALKADEERRLWELVFKGYVCDDAMRLINQAKAFANTFGATINKRVHPFAFWLTLGSGESRMVGKVEQGAITPPAWNVKVDELSKRLVSKDDYLRFIELRKELDAWLATGRYSRNQQPLPQLAGVGASTKALPDATNGAHDGDVAF